MAHIICELIWLKHRIMNLIVHNYDLWSCFVIAKQQSKLLPVQFFSKGLNAFIWEKLLQNVIRTKYSKLVDQQFRKSFYKPRCIFRLYIYIYIYYPGDRCLYLKYIFIYSNISYALSVFSYPVKFLIHSFLFCSQLKSLMNTRCTFYL